MDGENDVVVKVKQGLLKGKTRTDFRGGSYYSFQGIPYAKPPLGKLRFKSPQPPEPWTGIRDATEEGSECYSRHVFLQHIVGSEDCLVLNVYTPEIPTKFNRECIPKPVMVWIHGGAFICGSSKIELYSPDYLIRENVVLVTINYRLGVLGFLNLEDPTLEVTGNAGLKDIVMALQWLKNNISEFGGDKENVTIFGESAGGAAVHFLMLSPLAKGLFHKAIAQSGCALNCWATGYNFTTELARHLNLTEKSEKEILTKLQDLDVEQLFEAQEKLDHNFYAHKPRPIGPVIETSANDFTFLNQDPIKIILSGSYNKVPLMIGYTSREGMLLEVIQEDKNNLQVTTNFEDVIPFGYNVKRGSVLSKEIASKIKHFYYGIETPTNQDMEKFHIVVTDSYFLEAIYRAVSLHAKTLSEPIYFYRVSLETKLNFFKNLANIKAPGVCHGDELGYLFKTDFSPEIENNSREEASIKKFTKLWTNFARYGNPNGQSNGIFNDLWKPVTENEVNFLDIGDKLKPDVDPESNRMKLWKEIQDMSKQRCKL